MVAGKKWGGDWKTLKKQYSAICKRKIHYVCQIYNTAFAGRLKKLDCILRENQNYEENERSIKPTGVHMRRLEQRYMREQMEIEEMNQTQPPPWLVNNILFCYEGDKHYANESEKKQNFLQHKGKHVVARKPTKIN